MDKPLLSELHAHTTWSDGALTVAELVDLYGHAGFDVLVHGLLLIPGLELTYDDPDPRRAAHALAIGLREHVDVNAGLEQALGAARSHGAALIGAHPYALGELGGTPRSTADVAEEPEGAAEAVHRFEVCNRHDFFAWVARARLPVVASGDFHRPEHLATWKTLLPTEKSEEAVVDYLRSRQPAFLAPFEPAPATVERAA